LACRVPPLLERARRGKCAQRSKLDVDAVAVDEAVDVAQSFVSQ